METAKMKQKTKRRGLILLSRLHCKTWEEWNFRSLFNVVFRFSHLRSIADVRFLGLFSFNLIIL